MTPSRRLIVAVVSLLVIAAAGSFIVLYAPLYDCESCDFDTYVAASQRLSAGQPLYADWQSEPYRLIDAARGRGYIYPPPAAVLMAWTAWIPEALWRALNLGSLLIVVALMMRRHGSAAMLGAIAAVMAFPPTTTAWSNGQITPLLAAGFGAAYLFPRWAWAIAAVGGAIKLFPFILLAWVVRERGWREAVYAIVIAAVIAVVTLPGTGTAAWPAFLQAMGNGAPNCNYDPVNSIQCTLGPSLGPGAAQGIAFALAGAMAVASLLVRSRVLAFMLLCVAVLVATPDLNRPYWLFLLLAATAAAAELIAAIQRRREASIDGRPAERRARPTALDA